jgi:hypothetical protein
MKMNELLRTAVAALVGGAMATAVVVGEPALATQVQKVASRKVTSAKIKDHTIKVRDLSAEVTGPLTLAGTALQSLPDGSVTSTKIAAGSVTTTKLADGSVTTPKLAAGSVSTPKLADGSVTTPKLAAGSVTNGQIADGNVNGAKLSPDAVSGSKVADGSLRAADLAVFTGSLGVNVPSLNPDQCTATTGIETGQVVTGDFILVSDPAGVAGNIQISGREDAGSSSAIDLVFCNEGNAAFDPPATSYFFAVIGQ